MLGFYAAVGGLALGGFDPIGAFVAVAALSAGAGRRAVLLFTAVSLLVPVVLGVALSASVGAAIARIELPDVDWDSPWWAVCEVAVGLLLLGWALRRGRRPRRARPDSGDDHGWSHLRRAPGTAHRPRATGAWALAGIGAGLSTGVLLDPTFLGTVVLAAREATGTMIAAHVLWSVVGQVPLVAVGVAVAAGRHGAAVRLTERVRNRFGPAARHAVTGLLLVVALVLFADVAGYAVTGRYLIG
ncbi:hypothetical protein [Actinomadura flavalba]|uniref:hypothetical protein n=1 Tax=Actinomadura flavalba TaxID=1120938 RepID=UPI000377F89D|nr:hypothetical protein [Actinomadura flavalba]